MGFGKSMCYVPLFLDKVLHHFFFLMVICNSLLLFKGIYTVAVAVHRQRVIHTENSGFASPTLGQHISTFRGYRILFSTFKRILQDKQSIYRSKQSRRK
jgi:hypothetical protein